MREVSRLLAALDEGDPHGAAELLPLVYEELRQLAAQRLAQEQPGQTLQPTALVHEAYLRLVGNTAGQQWNSRGHFFAAAAEAMRRILIDNARRKHREKRGGGRQRLDLENLDLATFDRDEELLDLNEALEKLGQEEPVKAEIVKLRYFAGLSLEETAAALGLSLITVKRHWAVARAWLYDALHTSEPESPEK